MPDLSGKTGARSVDIRSLSEIASSYEVAAVIGKSMNVCIVSSGFLGPVKNGGIGTATSGLARQLVSDGHNVTLLYTYVGDGKPVSGDRPWQYWVRQLAGEGIVLEYIPLDDD